jgi:sulfate transport system ATP-binding protein
VLLLDEPFGALDAQVRKELRNWLRNLHDEMHVTTVFVTHDQEEAMEVSDNIVVMASSRVEQVGTPDELYDHPANAFVMRFLGPTTELDGMIVRPHDLELSVDAPGDGAGTVARVSRITRLGFEVRVDLQLDGAGDVSVQATRREVDHLGLTAGSTVRVRAASGSIMMPAGVGSAGNGAAGSGAASGADEGADSLAAL